MERFVKAARVGDIERDGSKLVRINGISIAIFNAGGAFYAAQDCCTGDGGSLSKGTLMNSTVMCPSDKTIFYLPTGECLRPAGLRSLVVCEVQIDRSEIKIDLEAALAISALSQESFEANHHRAS
jgi:3-phenylpropionate/trans-cinnamate dioxygenase ferredoxin subunit